MAAECKGCKTTKWWISFMLRDIEKNKQDIANFVRASRLLQKLADDKMEQLRANPRRTSTVLSGFDNNCEECHEHKKKYDSLYDEHLELKGVRNHMFAVFREVNYSTDDQKNPDELLWDHLVMADVAMRIPRHLKPYQKRAFAKLKKAITEVVEDMFLDDGGRRERRGVDVFEREAVRSLHLRQERILPSFDIDYADLRRKRKAVLPQFSQQLVCLTSSEGSTSPRPSPTSSRSASPTAS